MTQVHGAEVHLPQDDPAQHTPAESPFARLPHGSYNLDKNNLLEGI